MNFTYVLGFVVLRDVVKVFPQGSKKIFSNTRQGGSKRKVLVANVAVKLKFQSPIRQILLMQRNAILVCF